MVQSVVLLSGREGFVCVSSGVGAGVVGAARTVADRTKHWIRKSALVSNCNSPSPLLLGAGLPALAEDRVCQAPGAKNGRLAWDSSSFLISFTSHKQPHSGPAQAEGPPTRHLVFKYSDLFNPTLTQRGGGKRERECRVESR